MATLAAAFASSHSLMLASDLEDWLTRFRHSDPRMPYYNEVGAKISYDDVLSKAPVGAAREITDDVLTARFHRVQSAMRHLRGEITAANLDALVIVGDDQHELFLDQHMPSIAIHYGASIRNARQTAVPGDDWFRNRQMRRLEPDDSVDYPCHAALAQHLIEGLVEAEFDVSAVAALRPEQYEGHAYSFIHRWYLNDGGPLDEPGTPYAPTHMPVVPVFLNTYNPPNQPTPRRCVKLGLSLRTLLNEFPGDQRVGIIASGGLSHFKVEEQLDREFIEAMRNKDLDYLATLDPRQLKAGSSEIRNWIVVAAAATELSLNWVSYTPAYRSPALTGTGLGFASWS